MPIHFWMIQKLKWNGKDACLNQEYMHINIPFVWTLHSYPSYHNTSYCKALKWELSFKELGLIKSVQIYTKQFNTSVMINII